MDAGTNPKVRKGRRELGLASLDKGADHFCIPFFGCHIRQLIPKIDLFKSFDADLSALGQITATVPCHPQQGCCFRYPNEIANRLVSHFLLLGAEMRTKVEDMLLLILPPARRFTQLRMKWIFI